MHTRHWITSTVFRSRSKSSGTLSAQWIWQGHHMTSPGGYVDTLDFTARPSGTGKFAGSIVRAFSISGVHGAFSDYGQNYKNLCYLALAVYGEYGVATCSESPENVQIVFGCGAK